MAHLGKIVHVLGSHGHMTREPKLLNWLITINKQLLLTSQSNSKEIYLVTKFILGKHSRQEFEPLLGPVVDKAKCEPSHFGNNCWQQ